MARAVRGLRARIVLPASADRDEMRRGWSGLLGRLFDLATIAVGKAEARRLFVDAGRRDSKGNTRGRGKGAHYAPWRDVRMLAVYEGARELAREKGIADNQVVSLAGEFLYDEDPKAYGNSTEAIEKHLRRLLVSRQQKPATTPDDDPDPSDDGDTFLGGGPGTILRGPGTGRPAGDK